MEVVADLIDGTVLGLGQVARLVKGVWALSALWRGSRTEIRVAEQSRAEWSRAVVERYTFLEEEAYFVPRLEEVLVAHMVRAVVPSGREFGHGVVGEREVVEHLVYVGKQVFDGVLREGIWHEEVAIVMEEAQLL